MVYSTHSKMPLPQRARVLTAAALLSAVLVAGCGGSSHSPSVATVGDATSSASTVASTVTTSARSTTSSRAATSSGPSSASSGSGALAFARCMRANGVPNFPDPQPGGGELFQIPAGANPAAPAFAAARAKCQNLLPDGRLPPGSGPPPSDQTLAKLVRIAECMRQHGISDFPDPRTSAPASFPPGIAEETNFRRSGPAVPTNAQHASAGVHTGAGRVRRAATWPPTLIRTGADASNATAALRPPQPHRDHTTPRPSVTCHSRSATSPRLEV